MHYVHKFICPPYLLLKRLEVVVICHHRRHLTDDKEAKHNDAEDEELYERNNAHPKPKTHCASCVAKSSLRGVSKTVMLE